MCLFICIHMKIYAPIDIDVYIFICIHTPIHITYTYIYIYMCVCVRVCMYVYMHVCMYVCMWVCMRVCLYVCMYVCMHACMYACMHACVCVKHLKRCKTSNRCFQCFCKLDLILSRGHSPIVDTCANEAIPQWGKRRLITSVYLQFSHLSSMATG